MKRIAILLLALAGIANGAYAQMIPGPDPRGRSVRPFNPLWGVLVVRVEQIDTAPKKTFAEKIDACLAHPRRHRRRPRPAHPAGELGVRRLILVRVHRGQL